MAVRAVDKNFMRRAVYTCNRSDLVAQVTTHRPGKAVFLALWRSGGRHSRPKMCLTGERMLTSLEKAVRQTLIRACQGQIETYHHRKITYKVLWEHHAPPGADWGPHCISTVVRWIVNISDYDIANGRPPSRRESQHEGGEFGIR